MTVPAGPVGTPPTAPDTPEISARMLRGLLLYFERTYGRERLLQVWARERLPLSLEYVETLTNYVSLDFTERLFEELSRDSADPEFITRAGMTIASPDAVGFLFFMMKALATPRSSYERAVELGHTYNRVGSFTILQLTDTRMMVTYSSRLRERNRNLCRARQANLSAFPLIWDLPPAEVREMQCQVEGAPHCEYHIRWQVLPPVAWRQDVGGLVGVVVGLMANALQLAPAGFAVMSLSLAGVALGAWLDTRASLLRKDQQLSEQHTGLQRSLEDLQRRNEEIFRANLALEDRVVERTRELSEANAKLEESLNRQKELDRLKSEFFDNVSHELRTPLTLILLTLESLQQKDPASLPPPVRHALSSMDRSAQRLLRLINNLLDLAQVESGKARLRYEPLELFGFLNSQILPFRAMADKQGVVLTLEGQPVTPVLVDHERIDIVFQNLLSNALKFTQVGSVTVRVHEDDTHVHVDVKDTGSGISPKDLKVIFDRFAQADNSGTRRFGGTGIGLALVKETLELHDGGIEVASEQGQGSTFFVHLPKGSTHIRESLRERRRVDMPVRRDRRQSGSFPTLAPGVTNPGAESSPGRDHEGPSPDAQCVLLVEDDLEIRAFVSGLLQQHYRVLEAVDGEQGRQRALADRPDLIVSDVMMPVLSGMQMLAALRADVRTMDIPVILLTARQEVQAKVEGLGAGANDYLGKPFSPRELLARVETQLRLREAAVRAAENERLAAIGLLTSGFAHEVRNPLNGLMNALLPLKDAMAGGTADPSMGSAMVELIEECGQRIRHLAESLLSFVRTAEKPVSVRLDTALDSTLNVLAWRVPAEVSVERVYQCGEPVMGDPGSLNQVWLNLVDNALRAVGPHGRVRVTTAREGDEAVVTISDDGVGIRPEDMDRLFQPFFSTRAAGEGTGLGLALSRRIVMQHGGRINLTSELGKGTQVQVRLPLRTLPTPTQSDATGDGRVSRLGRLG